ncbi:Unknown protein [Striga hermonthica]|uniref:Uncharacterized protein n=1 Tax=Striga hermonthica TaxID=68872 RepID=A0A9N7NF27_STRHE|nr:Unknown protein [Striga hermonthica]
MLQSAKIKASCTIGGLRQLAHAVARLLPLSTAIDPQINTSLLPLIFSKDYVDKDVRDELPCFPFPCGAMELMVVPIKKASFYFFNYLTICFEDFS